MTRINDLKNLRKHLGFYGMLAASFCVFIALVAKPYFGTRYSYDVGDVSREDIVSPRDVAYVNLRETEKRIEEVKRRLPAVFDFKDSVSEEAIKNIRGFFVRIERLDGSGASTSQNKEELAKIGYEGLDTGTLRDIFANYQTKKYGETLASSASLILGPGLSGMKRVELLQFAENGILLKKIRATEITQEKVEEDRVYALDEVPGIAETYFGESYRDLSAQNVHSLIFLSTLFLRPNLFYNRAESIKLVNEEVEKVRPVLNTVKKSAIVIRRGEEINEENLPKLRAVMEYTSSFNAKAVAGIGILLLLILFLSAYPFVDENFKLDMKSYVILVFFLLFSVAYAYLISLIKHLPPFILFGVLIPMSGITMTAELLYGRRSSLSLALVLPVFLLLISGNDPYTFIFAMGSGLVAIYAVKDAEKRSDILKSCLYTVSVNLLILAAIGLLKELPPRDYVTLLVWGAGNAVVSVILAMGIIPFFEIIMNVPTNFRLLEISDLNAPIMKRIQIEAPGTYYHSINVANMAESAARAVHANPLLSRVAALYHDIGKIPNAEYYVENNPGRSKHDAIKPSLSNTILKAHVKIGIDMARKIKLPKEVIEIIAQHHGTSLIKYFYHLALKRQGEGEEIAANDYHYQGPKPQSREAAIVLLADAVEAASRTLKNPSAKRIEEFVSEIIEGKFREGQLNESPLTLRGLLRISIAFRRYLTGVFHTRIEYPDDREIESVRRDQGNARPEGGRRERL